MTLKVYADRMSQPSRTVILFCKLNGIDFEEVKIDLAKRQHLTSEFKGTPNLTAAVVTSILYGHKLVDNFVAKINPMKLVPVIVDGRFKLFESHAILIYLAGVFPGVADHWYPADVFKRAKIHSVLDWYHSNLRLGSATYVRNSTLAPLLGLPLNPIAAAEAEKLLLASLVQLESVWLKGKGRFLLGSFQPSIADLSLACGVMHLEILDDEDRDRILGPHKRVLKWIEDTRIATRPHFDEVHSIVFKLKEKLKKQPSKENGFGESESIRKAPLHSKM